MCNYTQILLCCIQQRVSKVLNIEEAESIRFHERPEGIIILQWLIYAELKRFNPMVATAFVENSP